MTTEKAIEILSDVGGINRCCAEDAEALDMAIKALEQQPCVDCISRQAVINAICAWGTKKEQNSELMITMAEVKQSIADILADLPSVTPQPKTGKWIEVFVETPNDPYSYGFKSHKCSKCEHRPLQILNYCPNCGAKMEEIEE